jgi:MFS family permease
LAQGVAALFGAAMSRCFSVIPGIDVGLSVPRVRPRMTQPSGEARAPQRTDGGAFIGIVLGGLIVTYVSWRWIFLINVPVGMAALAVATQVLHDRAVNVTSRRTVPARTSR